MATQTTQELIDYYADLLIKQYKEKPKAYRTIEMLVEPILMPQAGEIVTDNEGNVVYDNEGQPVFEDYVEPILPVAVQNGFDIETAVGAQLDTLGKYIGASRQGFDFSGAVTLTDDQYRQLLTIVAARYRLTAKCSDIQDFIHKFFDGTLQVFDNKFMHMSYFYLVDVGVNIIAEFFIKMGLLPSPLGVGTAPLIRFFPTRDWFALRDVVNANPNPNTGLNSVGDPQVGTFMSVGDIIQV
jgi:hypothetical protein